MKRNENKSKIVTRGIKGAILALVMAVSGIVSPMTAYAGTTEYDKWDVDVCYGEDNNVTYGYAMMDADATFEVYTGLKFWEHSVDSVGQSKIKWNLKTGYTGKLKKNGHKIVVEISGIMPEINLQDASTLTKNSSKATFTKNTRNVSFHIYSECTSLIKYNQKHYGDVVVSKKSVKYETLQVLSVLKY